MRTGYERDYSLITLKGCTATLSDDEPRLATEKNYPMFSRPMNHDEFITELSGKKSARSAVFLPTDALSAVL